ncbi:MAG: glycoside hydrolase/phage tail family protein [Pseudomonadota bacterium]
MAQLLLTTAASAVGSIAKVGIGAAVARTVASTAAAYATSSLNTLIFGPRRRRIEGPRLESISVQASTEGAGIFRVYGRARISGQLIWATNFKETSETTSESVGGKGGPRAVTEVTEYAYSASFAVGLCEGVIDRVARVWADGKLIDLSRYNVRIYRGDETQGPDDLIVATESSAPAFRGLAYVVVEDLPLAEFGNRIPQLSFEIEKSLRDSDPQALENALTAVTMIPGSGEFVYGTTPVSRIAGEGISASENAHATGTTTDFVAAVDALTANAPNLKSVSLIVSWFGDTLDIRYCKLRPGVDFRPKETSPYLWEVSSTDRDEAHLITQIDGGAAYGGTPSDQAVIEAIRDLNARGLQVMFHPFILMDAPGFPWRGRIAAWSSDGTNDATNDVAGFFGNARPSDFVRVGDRVDYIGAEEWSFRRFILHCAHLCVAAGGVESFLLGSELRGLSTVRDQNKDYPAVGEFVSLAADVRAILGSGTKISYGADWSEWFGHQPTDGSGDVSFHLDPLWASPTIDFIGIDNYMPLADWRDGFDHLDREIAPSPYDLAYLKGNIRGGERFDWFYASDGDRTAQIRSAISDGAYGKDWIFRPKDLWGWWSNSHYDRPGGIEATSPTAWQPQMKPIRFTEIGCGAVDKAANAPNVFVDAKSDESGLPPFSNGARDDLIQRRFLEAHFSFWREASNNPISSAYGGTMVDATYLYAYAYDARPFPFFPARRDIWGDADNWETGHWLNGRLGRAPLDLLFKELAQEADPDGESLTIDASHVDGTLTGYVIDRPMSVREMIDPLADLYQIDCVETEGGFRFQARQSGFIAAVSEAGLVDAGGPRITVAVREETAAPSAFRLGFIDEGGDYEAAVVEARTPVHGVVGTGGASPLSPGASPLGPGANPGRHEAGLNVPVVLNESEASARTRTILADAQVMRETVQFSLPPSAAQFEPGDLISTEIDGAERTYRITTITDGVAREIEAARYSPSVFDVPLGRSSFRVPPAAPAAGPPVFYLLDLPLMRDGDDPSSAWFAAFSDPWPGSVALYRGQESLLAIARANIPAGLGRLSTPLPPGPAHDPSGRFLDQSVRIRLSSGALAARPEEDVLEGANALAVETGTGRFEILQYKNATLQPDGTWELSGLLRGQSGTEQDAMAGANANAAIVLLGDALTPVPLSIDLANTPLSLTAGDGALPVSSASEDGPFTRQEAVWQARGLKPLSPVHLSVRDVNGDLMLEWIRRTRIGGDGWGEADVPLAEAFERYQVAVTHNGQALRQWTVDQMSTVYGSEMILNDLGGDPSGQEVVLSVAQISDLAGAGDAASLAYRF